MKQCFAMHNGLCSALTSSHCDGCPFFKDTKQIRVELEASEKRLRKLGKVEAADYNKELVFSMLSA